MSLTRSTRIKVIGKETSRGFFGGKKYTVIITVIGNKSPLPVAVPVPIEQYYHFQEGLEYNITMYQHSDGLWYFQPE